MMNRPLIINLAPTGMIPTKDMTPHVPLTVDEIVADVIDCVKLGASMVHLHARDEKGAPSYKAEYYQEIITRIRSQYPDVVIVVTTSGRTFNRFAERSEVLHLEQEAKPDMASLTLSSVNFNKQASINSPDMILELAYMMQQKEIKPEMEIFDLGMVNFSHYLIKKKLISPPYYFNIILGNIAAAQAKLMHLGMIVSELPQPSYWSVSGIGRAQFKMNGLGIVMGDGVRIGLEDNIWYDDVRTVLATNSMLVKRITAIAEAFGRPIASAAYIRNSFDLASPFA